MISKNARSAKKSSDNKRLSAQQIISIVCVAIMVTYVVLASFIAQGSFWDFCAFHVTLIILTILALSLSFKLKVMSYVGMSLGILGAFTAILIMLYYLWIVIVFGIGLNII